MRGVIRIAFYERDSKILQELGQIARQCLEAMDKTYLSFWYQDKRQITESTSDSYDIIFFDIEKNRKKEAKIMEKFRENDKTTEIIYLVDADYYNGCLRAFAVTRPFGYIEKPVTYSKLHKELTAFFDYRQDAPYNLRQPNMLFKTVDGIKMLQNDQVFYIKSDDRINFVVTDQEVFTIDESIKQVYERYQNLGLEICHRSYLVNLTKIKNIKGNKIFLTSKTNIPLAQKRAKAFKKKYADYLSQYI